MVEQEITIAGRLERLPWSSFHTKLLIILSIGEFFELYSLFISGFVIAPVANYYKISTVMSVTYTAAVVYLGAFFGALIFTLIGDAIGRRTAIIINMFIIGFGFLLTPFAPNATIYAMLRFITGLGIGPEALIVLDVMITEFFPGKFRGRALARGYTIGWTAPIVVAALAYFLIPENYILQGWQWMFIIGALGVLMILPIRFIIPESPRWLETKGRLNEANKIVSEMENIATKQFGKLQDPVKLKVIKTEKIPIKEIFSKEFRKRTIMLWIFEFLQAGVYYGFASLAPTVLYMHGFSVVKTLTYIFIIYTSYFFSSVISMFVIDNIKFDRKWQTAVIMLLMGLDGLAFGYSNKVYEIIVTGFLFGLLSNIFSNAYHQYGAELYPTRIRAIGDGIQYSLSRLGSYVFLSILPIILTLYGAPAMFTVVLIMTIIIFIDVAVLGPKASQTKLEELST